MHPSDSRRYLAALALGFALGAVALPGYVEIFPENVFPEEYGAWRAQLDFVKGPASASADALVIGDSRALAALLPERLGPGARSIAMGGVTPIEGYYLLSRTLEHHAPPRVLLVSFSPFHLERADLFWERTVKWKALRAREYLEVFRRTSTIGDDVLGPPEYQQLAARWLRLRLNFLPDYAPELDASRLVARRGPSEATRREVERSRGHLYFGRRHRSSEHNQEALDRNGFEASPLIDAYLRDTLSLATRHGIRVVVAAMPMNHSSWIALDPRYIEAYRAYMARLATDHPRAVFRAGLWTLPNDHFGDASHVNSRGARAVTDALAPLLAPSA